jgi:thiamine-phosphate pyrophosphorylase
VTLPDPPILAITDRRQCAETLEVRAERLFSGGCRWLSVREKDLDAADRLALLRRLIAIGDRFGARVGIHDDPAAAIACAAPLHLPSNADVAAARRRCGQGMLIGRSCHAEADVGNSEGADYATLSPAFRSASKPGYAPTLSPGDLGSIGARSRIPVLALGGVTRDTVRLLAGARIAGLAVMGEAMRAPAPEAWFESLTAEWRKSRGGQP